MLSAAGDVAGGLWVHGSDVLIQSNDNGKLLASHDFGASFTRYPVPSPGLPCQFQEMAPSVLWEHCVTGMMSDVWRSLDGGATFQPAHCVGCGPRGSGQLPLQPNSATFAAASARTAVVGYQQLYQTADGGAHWTPVGPKGLNWVYLGFTDATHGVGLARSGSGTDEQPVLHDRWRSELSRGPDPMILRSAIAPRLSVIVGSAIAPRLGVIVGSVVSPQLTQHAGAELVLADERGRSARPLDHASGSSIETSTTTTSGWRSDRWQAASAPLIPGIRWSSSISIGDRIEAAASAASPEAASPTNVNPSVAVTMSRIARRNASWSSTTSTVTGPSDGCSALRRSSGCGAIARSPLFLLFRGNKHPSGQARIGGRVHHQVDRASGSSHAGRLRGAGTISLQTAHCERLQQQLRKTVVFQHG